MAGKDSIKSEIRSWQDETAGTSKIQGLNFEGDREWLNCEVSATGLKSSQSVDLTVNVGGETKATETFTLRRNETKTISTAVKARTSISVGGALRNSGVLGAGARVTATCTYEPGAVLRKKSSHWQDETGGTSCIEGLWLDGDHKWTGCEIIAEGLQARGTGCMLTLIVNGELRHGAVPNWMELNGTESKVFNYPVGEKVPLLVAGYITNHKLTGGGAKITLTGFYEEGE